MTPTLLWTLPDQRPARVTAVQGSGLLRERLAELGFVPGVEVEVLRRAAFGGPLQVRVRGGTLALRRDEANCVHVDPDLLAQPAPAGRRAMAGAAA